MPSGLTAAKKYEYIPIPQFQSVTFPVTRETEATHAPVQSGTIDQGGYLFSHKSPRQLLTAIINVNHSLSVVVCSIMFVSHRTITRLCQHMHAIIIYTSSYQPSMRD